MTETATTTATTESGGDASRPPRQKMKVIFYRSIDSADVETRIFSISLAKEKNQSKQER